MNVLEAYITVDVVTVLDEVANVSSFTFPEPDIVVVGAYKMAGVNAVYILFVVRIELLTPYIMQIAILVSLYPVAKMISTKSLLKANLLMATLKKKLKTW